MGIFPEVETRECAELQARVLDGEASRWDRSAENPIFDFDPGLRPSFRSMAAESRAHAAYWRNRAAHLPTLQEYMSLLYDPSSWDVKPE